MLAICCFSCKKNNKREILLAENHYLDIVGNPITDELILFADSNYIYTKIYKSAEIENIEHRKGKFYIKNDTIHFSRNLRQDIESRTAIVRDNYFEIVDEECYKIKVVKTELPNRMTYDNQKFKSYAIFSYCQARDSSLFKNAKPHELNNDELTQLDSLLEICMSENTRLKTQNNNNYYKQCIATENSDREVVVWIYCICHKSGFIKENEFQLQLHGMVQDGGECFFKLKINLTRKMFFGLLINGDA
jgi:hypothetical protein